MIKDYNICRESIETYLYIQDKIKDNMTNLSKECPDKVIKFLLEKESVKTIDNLKNCTWSDSYDKKTLLKLIMNKCENL